MLHIILLPLYVSLLIEGADFSPSNTSCSESSQTIVQAKQFTLCLDQNNWQEIPEVYPPGSFEDQRPCVSWERFDAQSNQFVEIVSMYKDDGFDPADLWADRVMRYQTWGFRLNNATRSDSSTYRSCIRTGEMDTAKSVFEINVTVVEDIKPKLSSSYLKVERLDNDINVFDLQCGTFETLGNPAVNIVWIYPNGSRSNGTFSNCSSVLSVPADKVKTLTNCSSVLSIPADKVKMLTGSDEVQTMACQLDQTKGFSCTDNLQAWRWAANYTFPADPDGGGREDGTGNGTGGGGKIDLVENGIFKIVNTLGNIKNLILVSSVVCGLVLLITAVFGACFCRYMNREEPRRLKPMHRALKIDPIESLSTLAFGESRV